MSHPTDLLQVLFHSHKRMALALSSSLAHIFHLLQFADPVAGFPFAGNWSSQLFNPKAELDSRFESPIEPKDYRPLPDPLPNMSEECLVLDVFVPKRIYDNEDKGLRPVIVSFHGGGFIFGSKTIFGSPAGILKAAGEKGDEGDVIVVSKLARATISTFHAKVSATRCL